MVDTAGRTYVRFGEVVVGQTLGAGGRGADPAVEEFIGAEGALSAGEVVPVGALGATCGVAVETAGNQGATFAQPSVDIKLVLAGCASVPICAFVAIGQSYVA